MTMLLVGLLFTGIPVECTPAVTKCVQYADSMQVSCMRLCVARKLPDLKQPCSAYCEKQRQTSYQWCTDTKGRWLPK